MLKSSVVVATYNGSEFIREQLDSIAAQSRLPDEIVISDDGSNDDTIAVCRAFSSEIQIEVRIFESGENLGYARNFERAISRCRGDLVFLCDQDDVWRPNKIEHMTALLEQSPGINVAIHDLEYCDTDLNRSGHTKLQRLRSYTDPARSYVTGMATVVRRAFASLCYPMPDGIGLGHDDWLHRCAFALSTKAIDDAVLADYRRHESNATTGHLNSPERSSWAENQRHQLSVSSHRALSRNLAIQVAIGFWLESMKDRIDVQMGEGAADRALMHVSRAARLTRNRLAVLESLPVLRPVYVLRELALGTYAEFSGFKSAFKDLIRGGKAPLEE